MHRDGTYYRRVKRGGKWQWESLNNDANAAYAKLNVPRLLVGPNAPNPHDVAEAVAKLVATPKGQRPDRVVVGQAFGSDAVSAAVAPIQRQVVEGLGLGALTAVKA